MKLGRWNEYLAMRAGVLKLNGEFRDVMSNDLGAVGGLLFDIGSGRYAAPPREDDPGLKAAWEADLARVRGHGSLWARFGHGLKAIDAIAKLL